MNARFATALAGALLALAGSVAAAADTRPETATIARGRYLVTIAGCNDCHTPGYAQSGGKVPESAWLTGSNVGFRGPWGTSYPKNLRLSAHELNEAQWIHVARSELRPPMPWFALRDMKDDDVRAIYRYVRSLGPAGQPTPAAAPPGAAVETPYIVFVPENLPAQHAAK